MIRLEHLQKYFNKGKQNEIHVIHDISLELPERGMVAVFGKSGCGKTTLLNVIGGLDRFSGGTLSVDGQSIRTDTDALRNREMGYIFQNYNLNVSESCYDNVADALRLCGMKDGWQMRERVEAALTNVGMENFSARTPDTLSGGQQQRIAIARAIVKNPRIILADEPTGNLDEANTVLVMDLLKEIARDHLVLLVTHEEDLVDHYCDTVIELCDGRVVNVQRNEGATGLNAKDKNDIYLGELSKQTARTGEAVCVEYYGEQPASPVKLRVVQSGGKLYLRVDTPGVQILDDTSEVKLRDGVFEAQKNAVRDRERVNMTKLPPIQGTRYGRLYTFRSAVRSGWRANFSKRKRGKKFLLALMTLFSMVLVLMTSLFGTSIRTLLDAHSANSANTFYVYTPEDGAVSKALLEALQDPKTGIDGVSLLRTRRCRDNSISFRAGFFETFSEGSIRVSGHAVFWDHTLAEGKRLLAGRNTELGNSDLLISSALADLLLKSSTVGYLTDYQSLIGLPATGLSYVDWNDNTSAHNPRIAGVVESDEAAVYLDPLTLAQYVLANKSLPVFSPSTVDYQKEIATGTAVVYVNKDWVVKELPAVGKQITLHGMALTVAEVVQFDQAELPGFYYDSAILVNATDYIALSKQYGISDSGILYKDDIVIDKIEAVEGNYGKAEIDIAPGAIGSVTDSAMVISKEIQYTAVHSNDPKATAQWLAQAFAQLTPPNDTYEAIYTPQLLYETAISSEMETIVSNFISMSVIVIILCICIYFIMRSSLMKGIKEVGIYRAIGVTKKNLAYRFLIESAVLTALTTLVGFLLSSAVMRLWLHTTPLMEQIFYYPLWLAGCLLILIVGVCLLCGVLPALTLLRKTPSEILAKYDI